MSRRRNHHYSELPAMVEGYCEMRGLDFKRYSEYHMRVMDGGFTVFDVWTTGKYFLLASDYGGLGAPGYAPEIPRKGVLPMQVHGATVKLLDKVFFPESVKV